MADQPENAVSVVNETEGQVANPVKLRVPASTCHNNLIGLTVFVGAFLLFQVQLLIGKYILPWFGGSPGVWTVCLLFFQVLLLAGYAYSHFVAMRLSPSKQSRLHGGILISSILLLISLSFFWPSPITPGASWKPQGDANPLVVILLFLIVSVGLPFFLLSTTGPLLQNWFSRKNPGVSPYRLYSLSNLGSLLGLLSYPLLLEPLLHLRTQAWLWSVGYLLFAVLCVVVAPWKFPSEDLSIGKLQQLEASVPARPTLSQQLFWVSFAACGSAMLLASTNVISQDVAAFPFLWVLPLCLYLISFILCFEYSSLYKRGLFHLLFALTAFLSSISLFFAASMPLALALPLFLVAMFAVCMVCHGEIALSKPDPHYLTRFYLCISLGGAIGGIFVSVIAPIIFLGLWEFPLAIFMTGTLLFLAVRRDPDSWWSRSFPWMPLAFLSMVLLPIPSILEALEIKNSFFTSVWYRVLSGLLVLGAAFVYWKTRRRSTQSVGRWMTRATALTLFFVVSTTFVLEAASKLYHSVARSRNFYGVLTVIRGSVSGHDYLYLRDRLTEHGRQYLEPTLAKEPTSYYAPKSGIGLLLSKHPPRPIRVGLVGLGAGTLSAYAKPGDVFRFYEINSDVIRIAQGNRAYFTYLCDCQGTVEIVQGDARLSLEREVARGQTQNFDVLVLDAFSGDAVPVHLLTREAFVLYRQHLRSADSIIALHISNRALDLSPVLAGIAQEFHFSAVRIAHPWSPTVAESSDWVFLSPSPFSQHHPELETVGSSLPAPGDSTLWTDDYSNLLEVLR
jgi:spermidine synthase